MIDYAVGFLCGETCSSWFVDSLTRLISKENPPLIQIIGGPVLHRSRNNLSGIFLKSPWGEDAEKLVMLDSDIVFSVSDVMKLLEHDEDIVSGVYANASGKMMQIGAGFMSIKRHVLEALMPHPFNPVVMDDGTVSGEDVGFHLRAKEAGFKALVDQNLTVGHAKVQILRIVETGDRPVEILQFENQSPVNTNTPAEVMVGMPAAYG